MRPQRETATVASGLYATGTVAPKHVCALHKPPTRGWQQRRWYAGECVRISLSSSKSGATHAAKVRSLPPTCVVMQDLPQMKHFQSDVRLLTPHDAPHTRPPLTRQTNPAAMTDIAAMDPGKTLQGQT